MKDMEEKVLSIIEEHEKTEMYTKPAQALLPVSRDNSRKSLRTKSA